MCLDLVSEHWQSVLFQILISFNASNLHSHPRKGASKHSLLLFLNASTKQNNTKQNIHLCLISFFSWKACWSCSLKPKKNKRFQFNVRFEQKRQNKFWGLRHIIIHRMRYRQLAVMHYLLCNRQMTPQIMSYQLQNRHLKLVVGHYVPHNWVLTVTPPGYELPTIQLTPQAGSCALSTTQLTSDTSSYNLV